jgi:hypothetical protein
LRASLAKRTTGIWWVAANRSTAARNALPILGNSAGGGDRVAKMPGEKHHHLARDLQVRHVGVEVDAVQALQVEAHVAVEHVVEVAHRCCHGTHHEDRLGPPGRGQEGDLRAQPRPMLGGPRLASLGGWCSSPACEFAG